MRVSISTLTGVEVARLDTDATATLVDLLALLPNFDDINYSRRIFFGETEMQGHLNLSDIGVIEDSVLTVVFVPILRLLTASHDGTAKVWSAASGECLRTLMGHTSHVKSAVFSPDGQQVLTASERQDREGMVGCLGCMLAHFDGPRTLGLFCSLLARRPAGADRF